MRLPAIYVSENYSLIHLSARISVSLPREIEQPSLVCRGTGIRYSVFKPSHPNGKGRATQPTFVLKEITSLFHRNSCEARGNLKRA